MSGIVVPWFNAAAAAVRPVLWRRSTYAVWLMAAVPAAAADLSDHQIRNLRLVLLNDRTP
jgi:hypothetical protein